MQNILKYAMALALGALGLSAQVAPIVVSFPHQGPVAAPSGGSRESQRQARPSAWAGPTT